MEREIVLAVLTPSVCGPLAVACGALPTERAAAPAGWQLERFWWRRLWLPVLPMALTIALLAGWAIQEPEQSDEIVSRGAVWLALCFALLWVRAGSRAVRSLQRGTRTGMAAGTVGILRPRVVISPQLMQIAEPAILAAVREHEAAHVRHADPLRLWLAQLATDLQWPSPAARTRWRAWRDALEFARDDEARTRGVDGADLAEAILTSIRLQACGDQPAGALLGGGDGANLRVRIARLLAPLPQSATPPRTHPTRFLIVGSGIVGALVCGFLWGDLLVRALPIIRS